VAKAMAVPILESVRSKAVVRTPPETPAIFKPIG
jgi:hypothetical protein